LLLSPASAGGRPRARSDREPWFFDTQPGRLCEPLRPDPIPSPPPGVPGAAALARSCGLSLEREPMRANSVYAAALSTLVGHTRDRARAGWRSSRPQPMKKIGPAGLIFWARAMPAAEIRNRPDGRGRLHKPALLRTNFTLGIPFSGTPIFDAKRVRPICGSTPGLPTRRSFVAGRISSATPSAALRAAARYGPLSGRGSLCTNSSFRASFSTIVTCATL